jgi:hypothetical protein
MMMTMIIVPRGGTHSQTGPILLEDRAYLLAGRGAGRVCVASALSPFQGLYPFPLFARGLRRGLHSGAASRLFSRAAPYRSGEPLRHPKSNAKRLFSQTAERPFLRIVCRASLGGQPRAAVPTWASDTGDYSYVA